MFRPANDGEGGFLQSLRVGVRWRWGLVLCGIGIENGDNVPLKAWIIKIKLQPNNTFAVTVWVARTSVTEFPALRTSSLLIPKNENLKQTNGSTAHTGCLKNERPL